MQRVIDETAKVIEISWVTSLQATCQCQRRESS